MTDTPAHIKKLQQEIWEKKTPSERLRITLEENEQLFLFWKTMKENLAKQSHPNSIHHTGNI